jgi:hypothetical protein
MMEGLIGLLVRQGLNRDVAVNLVTDLLMTIIFGFVVAGLTNWFRDRSETKNSETLLEGPYRIADQCIVNYLASGRALARLGRQGDVAHRVEELARFEKRLRDVHTAGQAFQKSFALVGPGLTRRSFSAATEVSQGLARLVSHSQQMEGWAKDATDSLSQPSAAGRFSSSRMKFWLDFLGLAAGQIQSRRSKLPARRRVKRSKTPANLEGLSPPTGQLQRYSFSSSDLNDLAKAIWRPKGIDRAQIEQILIGGKHG